MDNELLYVRFVRGSLASYKALEVKSEDTLYFVYDEELGASALYLGTRLISGNGEIVGANNLDELNDVFLSSVANQDILIYDAESSQWNNLAFEQLVASVKAKLAHMEISVDENIFELDENGALKIVGFTEAEIGAVPIKSESGTIDWKILKDTDTTMLEADIATLKSDVSTLKSDIDTLETDLLNFSENVDTLSEDITNLSESITAISETLDNKADADSVYTKAETNTKIGEAVAAAAHLERKILLSINDLDLTDENVGKYVYMVPVESASGDDKYDEYMVIDGVLERVGSWDISLGDYALRSEVAGKVDKKENYSLIADSDIEKLSTVEQGAQVNIIDNVSEEFEISDDTSKTLKIKQIASDKIEDLAEHGTIKDIYSQITIVTGTVQNVADLLNKSYVTKEEHATELDKIKSAITWKEI